MTLAARLSRVQPSSILELVQKARALQSAGRDIIDLGIGEPDFNTPPHVIEAAHAAMLCGETKYTLVNGTVPMREAIIAKLSDNNGLSYEINQIIVCGGAKSIIYNAFMATLNSGDEVIVPTPYWTSYPDIIQFAQGLPVFVECPQSEKFRLTPNALSAAITDKTRWLILNSPSNPTGSAYTREELEAIGEVLKQHSNIRIMSDDIYEHLVYGAHCFSSIAEVCPALQERTLIINGVSKAYAMTGWRLGYAAGPKDVIAGMAKVQGQSTTHACSISQAAAIAAMSGPQDVLTERREIFAARRDLVVERLNAIDGIDCHKPEGAFYVYPKCAGLMGKTTPNGVRIDTDTDFCDYLLEEYGVSLVPGAVFGLSPHLRLSYAASTEALSDACNRIAAACAALK